MRGGNKTDQQWVLTTARQHDAGLGEQNKTALKGYKKEKITKTKKNWGAVRAGAIGGFNGIYENFQYLKQT